MKTEIDENKLGDLASGLVEELRLAELCIDTRKSTSGSTFLMQALSNASYSDTCISTLSDKNYKCVSDRTVPDLYYFIQEITRQYMPLQPTPNKYTTEPTPWGQFNIETKSSATTFEYCKEITKISTLHYTPDPNDLVIIPISNHSKDFPVPCKQKSTSTHNYLANKAHTIRLKNLQKLIRHFIAEGQTLVLVNTSVYDNEAADTEISTKFEWSKIIAKAAGIDKSLIQSCHQNTSKILTLIHKTYHKLFVLDREDLLKTSNEISKQNHSVKLPSKGIKSYFYDLWWSNCVLPLTTIDESNEIEKAAHSLWEKIQLSMDNKHSSLFKRAIVCYDQLNLSSTTNKSIKSIFEKLCKVMNAIKLAYNSTHQDGIDSLIDSFLIITIFNKLLNQAKKLQKENKILKQTAVMLDYLCIHPTNTITIDKLRSMALDLNQALEDSRIEMLSNHSGRTENSSAKITEIIKDILKQLNEKSNRIVRRVTEKIQQKLSNIDGIILTEHVGLGGVKMYTATTKGLMSMQRENNRRNFEMKKQKAILTTFPDTLYKAYMAANDNMMPMPLELFEENAKKEVSPELSNRILLFTQEQESSHKLINKAFQFYEQMLTHRQLNPEYEKMIKEGARKHKSSLTATTQEGTLNYSKDWHKPPCENKKTPQGTLEIAFDIMRNWDLTKFEVRKDALSDSYEITFTGSPNSSPLSSYESSPISSQNSSPNDSPIIRSPSSSKENSPYHTPSRTHSSPP